MATTYWRSKLGGKAPHTGDDLGPDPSAMAGSLVEVIDLDGGRPVRTHLRNIGFRPIHRRRWRERADWFVTKERIARIVGFGRANVYVRLRVRQKDS